MSLDQNLFTLNLAPRADDRNIVDLVDPKGVAHYTKVRVPTNEYKIEVYDPLSGSILATITAPAATSKQKTLQLYNPDIIVELKYTGTLTFKWGFKWEDHEFEWKREECFIIRKPDPSVLVAVTKEPPGRLQTRAVQILDYNLTRFDIQDRKGLEIVILSALLSFQDLNETYHTPRDGNTPATTPPAYTPTPVPNVPTQPPAVPPRPEPRKGVERVAEMHAVRTAQGEGEANEIEVGEECGVDDYAQYAERLLNDEAMLFVSVRSASAAQVPKVLRVVEETKRLRHKSGIAEDQELHQYVIYDTEKVTAPRKGPKRINLDDPDPKRDKGKEKDDKYVPPTSLTVHLSKIDMPELRPKANLANVRRPSGSGSPERPQAEMSDKERRRLEKEAKKAEKESKKKDKKKKDKDPQKDYAHAPPPPIPNKLSRPPPSGHQSSSSFGGYHTPAHRVHPHQPSPSPSQLNNPGIYTAPPPPPRARPVSMAFPMPVPPPFYDAGAEGGYHAMFPPSPPHPGANANVGYLSSPTQSGRPTSVYQSTNQSSSGKGPVSALLDMWSKH